MRVVAHGPHAWYMLEDARGFILAARCSRGAADFELLIRLSPEEAREYRSLGTVYANFLAARVDHWSREYEPRHEAASGAAVNVAIGAWRAGREGLD